MRIIRMRYILFLILFPGLLRAQDTLVRKDKTRLVAEVMSVSDDVIRIKIVRGNYSREATVAKKKIDHIIYHNGKYENIKAQTDSLTAYRNKHAGRNLLGINVLDPVLRKAFTLEI